MGQVVAQKLMKEVKNDIERGIKYYALLSALNNLNLSERQIQLLAFTAVRGTITPLPARKEFVKMFNSSLNSVENIKGILVDKGLIVKKGGMYKVLDTIDLDFSQEMVLQIKLKIKNEG
jgi:hypothetical protein